jgi:tetratricopeptide (TPR) repeat protein
VPPASSVLDRRAERLLAALVALSVYREPADRNAVLFQLGTIDRTAARVPDRQGPTPPYRAPSDLAELLGRCVDAGLVTVPGTRADGSGSADAWFVDRAIATELHAQLRASGRAADLAEAHRRAAAYWRWRATAWPQDRRADIHDLLETRHHLFSAGEPTRASAVTEVICVQLHAWGDLGREAQIVQSTLGWLPDSSPGRAEWLYRLGTIASLLGDHAEATRRLTAAARMFAALGDNRGLAGTQHSLGALAQSVGDYRKAERWYRKSAAAHQRADHVRDRPRRPAVSPALTPKAGMQRDAIRKRVRGLPAGSSLASSS